MIHTSRKVRWTVIIISAWTITQSIIHLFWVLYAYFLSMCWIKPTYYDVVFVYLTYLYKKSCGLIPLKNETLFLSKTAAPEDAVGAGFSLTKDETSTNRSSKILYQFLNDTLTKAVLPHQSNGVDRTELYLGLLIIADMVWIVSTVFLFVGAFCKVKQKILSIMFYGPWLMCAAFVNFLDVVSAVQYGLDLVNIRLQGLAWFALALAAIIVKHSASGPKATAEITTYSAYLSKIIYDEFMIKNRLRVGSKVIRPQDFEAFLWIYAVLSAVWVAAALDQNLAIKYKKPRQSYSTLVLGVGVLLTSVIDLVHVSLLARDLDTCPFSLGTTIIPTTTTTDSTAAITLIDCQLANGIVMSLAARGYVLWLINVVLSICLINIGAQALRTPTLLTYGNNTIPRIKLPEMRKTLSPNNNDNNMALFADNDGFPPPMPVLPAGGDNRNRNNTPMALNNKNQSIYY